jgi:hypothetical protein
MSDYISRAAVEEVLEKAQIISDGENCGYCTQDVNIAAIPAVDVAPVIYAEWIYDRISDYPRCSECGKDAINGEITPYCPHCGAMMGRKEMTFDELLDNIAAEHPEYKETIEASKIIADETTRFILKNDMVSVIRCKDCKHSESFPCGTREKWYCNLHDTTMRENDFCSRGESKDKCTE